MRKRLLTCGLWSLGMCAVVMLGEVAIANFQNGCAFFKYDPTGCIPLKSALILDLVVFPLGALVFGIFLPLYRWRYGGYVVGAFTSLAVLEAISMAYSRFNVIPPSTPLDSWQFWTVRVLGVIGMSVVAQGARGMVLGLDDGPPSMSPPSPNGDL
jgi:hypothetical protein